MTTPITPERAMELASLIDAGEASAESANAMRSLAKKVETLTAERDELQHKLYEDKHCQCGCDDVCEFARERDAFEADAKRYRWLRTQNANLESSLAISLVGPAAEHLSDSVWVGSDLDAVVDAAMKAAS